MRKKRPGTQHKDLRAIIGLFKGDFRAMRKKRPGTQRRVKRIFLDFSVSYSGNRLISFWERYGLRCTVTAL
jgi:hypothetical protein